MEKFTITKTIADEDTSTGITYVGEATYNNETDLATAKTLSIWRIQKMITTITGTQELTDEYYPVDGNNKANDSNMFIWNNRAAYSYK